MTLALADSSSTQSPSVLSVASEQQDEPLRECVRGALRRYLEQMGGHSVTGIQQMVLSEVEPPMLQTVLEHCGGNQTRAADMLGMSRSTLRKKLAQYGLTS
jgi:Fis family transcriptional regulator, factor for inversion stimulation protein